MKKSIFPLFALFLLCKSELLNGQNPVIIPVPLPAPDTLTSLPVDSRLNWAAKTNGQYYLSADTKPVLQRDSATGTAWVPHQLPFSPPAMITGMAKAAGTVCLATTVQDLNSGGSAIQRSFEILRTTGAWSAATTVFATSYFANTGSAQPFQLANYQTQLYKLDDSLLYFQIFLNGYNGAPSQTDTYYSSNAGASWSVAPVPAYAKARHIFAIQDGHFLQSDSPAFTNPTVWPLPDSSLQTSDLRGLFWAADTFYLYTNQGIRWKRTENTDWLSEQLPHCWIDRIQQQQGRCYASTSEGLYTVDHTRTNWKKLLAGYSQVPPYNLNHLVVLDSADLLYFTSAQGLVHSTDQGLTWQPFHEGLPQVSAYSLGFFGDSLLGNQYAAYLNLSKDGYAWRPLITGSADCISQASWLPVGAGGFVLTLTRHQPAPAYTGCQVWYTPDRSNWIATAPLPDAQNTPRLFYQQQRLWLVGSAQCLYSDDLGQHWSTLTLPADGSPYPDFGWVAQGDTIVFKDYSENWRRTTDLGQTWTLLNKPVPTPESSLSWVFRQKNQLLFCSTGGRIWASGDWGTTWTQTCSGLPGYNPDAFIYYAMKKDSVLGAANFLSPDAGRHWLKLTGNPQPVAAPALTWDREWLYFSANQRIYRVSSTTLLNGLAQLDTLGTTSSTSLNAIPDWMIQPNPVHREIHLTGQVPEFASWLILNSVGRMVAEGHLQAATIPIGTLPAGLYFLNLQTAGQSSVRRFMVTN